MTVRTPPRHSFLVRLLLCALAVAVPWGLGDDAGTARAAEVRNPDGVAVIIGNRDYSRSRGDIGEVAYAHRDAEAFRRYVIDVLGFDPRYVRVLEDAALGDMRSELGTPRHPGRLHSLVERRRLLNDGATVSDVVVFYSGHGMPSLNPEKPGSYLLPVDADPHDPERNGYSVEMLYEVVGALPARSVRVFLDACFTGVGGDGQQIVRGSPAMVTRLPEEVSENTISFTAAKANQVAYWDDDAGHGMFTQHVLDALYGGGDGDGDGRVTAREVERYLQEHLWHAVLDKNGREQDAVLLDGTGTGATVLATAPADGSFPTRPDLDAPDPVPVVGGPGDDGSTDGNEGSGTQPDGGDDDASRRPLDLAAVTGGDAFLKVTTTPPGAAVLLSGVELGITPLKFSALRAGTYTVTLDHPTHETVVLEDLTLADRRVLSIERRLDSATGSVTVMTEPVGAWVEHGGNRVGETTPLTLDGLPSGPQALTLGVADHHTVRVEVDVPKGGVALVERTLEKIRYGTLTLDLEPADARVALPDGGEPYRAGIRLAEGEYRVRVMRQGYHEVSRVVTVSGDTWLRITLEPVPQPFTVVTTPADAEVRFLERSERYVPGMALLPGTYRVQVSAEGWEAQEATIRHGAAPTRHMVELTGGPQPFTVVTIPPDAEVRFLGGDEAYRPGMALPAGTYRVRVSAYGWVSQEATVRHGTAPNRQAVKLRRPQPGDEFQDCAVCPEMVAVPAGSFMMGSPLSEIGRRDDEGEQHLVTIAAPFSVGKREVTFEEWDACVAAGGCNGYRPDDEGWGRGRHPVIGLTWADAKAYVRWLSQKTKQPYRLLSEAEWEYAARAGTTGPFHFGPTISTDQANYNGNYTYGSGRRGDYRNRTVPVGSFPANRFGLHDMHGNVWEWVEDCWHTSYAGAPLDGTAWVSGGDCEKRVLRGGSWDGKPRDLRSARRNKYLPHYYGLSSHGFRVARTLTP